MDLCILHLFVRLTISLKWIVIMIFSSINFHFRRNTELTAESIKHLEKVFRENLTKDKAEFTLSEFKRIVPSKNVSFRKMTTTKYWWHLFDKLKLSNDLCFGQNLLIVERLCFPIHLILKKHSTYQIGGRKNLKLLPKTGNWIYQFFELFLFLIMALSSKIRSICCTQPLMAYF